MDILLGNLVKCCRNSEINSLGYSKVNCFGTKTYKNVGNHL